MNELLKGQISSGNISHAYIFEGDLDTTKKLYTDFIEQIYINNDSRDKEIGLDRFFDVEVIEPEKNIITIDRIRELKKRIYEIPLEAAVKVFVIENADLMRNEAQNALLKTLEETPEYAIIILTTDNRNKLYDTVRSRCQIISTYQEEKKELTDQELYELIDLLINAYEKKYYAVISSKVIFEKYQDRKKTVIRALQNIINDIIMFKLSGVHTYSDKYKKKLSMFKEISMVKAERLVLILEHINELLRVNINFQLAMEHFLFAFMEE